MFAENFADDATKGLTIRRAFICGYMAKFLENAENRVVRSSSVALIDRCSPAF